jgi:hypothetical protein
MTESVLGILDPLRGEVTRLRQTNLGAVEAADDWRSGVSSLDRPIYNNDKSSHIRRLVIKDKKGESERH